MPVPINYNREDEDKEKKSSSGSSAPKSSSGSGGKNLPTQQYTPTQSQTKTLQSIQQGKQNQHARQAALDQYGGYRSPAWNRAQSSSGTRSGTRGSSTYNKQQQQYTQTQPANAFQANEQSRATQYGLQGIAGIGAQRPDIRSTDNWYAGDRPTDVEAAAHIRALNGGTEMMDRLLQSRYDPKGEFYSPSAVITNPAVYQLAALGVDIPASGLTDEWFAEVIPKVRPYYNPTIDSTTGAPKKPKKRAPIEEKIAYWVYQAYGEQENTSKAQREKAALEEEIKYLAGSSANYSDDEIAARIGWDKYPTLQKIDRDAKDGVPMNLNAAIGYSSNYLSGMIWAARNGGGTGDAFSDSVYALLGEGAGYEDNPEIRAKRTWARDNKDYSPYSLGPSTDKMSEAGMYFGKHSFTDEEVDELSERYLNSTNPNDVKMMQRVRAANAFTKDCEAELDALLNGTLEEDGTRTGGLDNAVADFSYSDDKSFEENLDALLEEVYGGSDYKNLEKLDDSMANGTLLDTTRAIDYRKQDIRALLAEKLQAKQTAPTVEDTGKTNTGFFDRVWNGLRTMFGGPAPAPDPSDLIQVKGEAGQAVEDTRQKTAASVGKTVGDIGTPSEKNQWRTGEIGQQEVSDQMGGNIKKGVPTGTGGQVMQDLIDGSIDGEDYINNRNTIRQYEDNSERLKGLQQEKDEILNRRKERKGGYINRNDEIAANFGANSTKGASLFGWFGGNKQQPEEDEEEVEAVEQEYRPAVVDMTLDQKTAWIQRKINNVNTTDEEAAGLRDLLAQYRASANWDDNDEAVPMQRQMLDDALAQYIGEPAYAPQNTGIDPEIAKLQQDAMDAVSKLNPNVETFEDAQAWLAEQTGDSEDLADAKDAVRLVEIAGEERVLNVRQEEMQGDYDKAFDMMKGLRDRYAQDQTVWTVTGSGGDTNLIAADVLDFVSEFAEYQPYPYSDTNYYDYQIKENGWSPEQAREEALKNNDSYRQLKDYIRTALDACDEKGVSIPAEYRQHMQQEMDRIDKLIADGTYYALRGNDDFMAVTDAAAKPKPDDEPGFVSPQNRPAGFTDMEWNIVSTPGTDVAPVLVREMNEDEQRTFLYLANKQGGKAAQKYYEHLTDEYGAVTTRRGREMTEAMYNDFRNLDAVTFNIGGTAATIAMHPFQMMSGLYTFGMAMTGKVANPDSAWNALSKASSRERETIKGIAVENVTSQLGETAGKLAGDGYDLITGICDNLWDATLMGAAGVRGPLGEVGEGASVGKKLVYNIVNGTVTAMPLGLSAAGMEYIDAIGRGLDPTQAYLLAGAAGLAESITEGLEIESFKEAYDVATAAGLKGYVQDILWSVVNEAAGEGAGQWFQNFSDDKIAGELSKRNQIFEQYVKAGYGKDEAHDLANRAMMMDIVKSAVMGGLSGGFSTALTGGAGAFHYESDYSSFRKTNAEYLTNLMNGFQDIGYSPTAAKQMADRYAREAYEAHAEEIASTANNMNELRAERRSVDLAGIEAEQAATENADRLAEADAAAEEFAEEQGEAFTPYTPAERPVNPRMEEANNFEITPVTQFNELADELAKIDGQESFDGEVKSEAVETLYSAVGYADMAQDAAANGDTQTADEYLRMSGAAFDALDGIMNRAGIDKGRFAFLTDTEALAQIKDYMTRHGPDQQFRQMGGEQTTLIPGESETAPIVDNEGLTAEDARAERESIREASGQTEETTPEINPVEAMETVNRGPEPLRPMQGPVRKNPFSADFKRTLAQNDRMKGQVLTLSETPATPASGATMLSSVFGSILETKDAISDGQAMAAAKRLVGKFDAQGAVNAVRSILVAAADQGISNTDTVNAIQTAALTDGEAGRILDNIINIGTATPNRVRNLVASAMREAGTLANEMWSNTYDGMVAEIVHRMAGEGALSRSAKAQADERARYSQLKEAQKTTETQEEVIAALQQKLTNAYDTFKATPLDKIAEAAFNSAQKQLDAAFSVLMSYRKSETNARNAHAQAEQNYFNTRNEEMTRVREAARQEADQRIAEARAQRQEKEAQRQARGNAIVGKKGTAYLNSTTPIDYHYELVDDDALVVSNDVGGAINPEYPSYLQPRDRTRAVSQYEVQDRAVHLNPEMLGANPDIAQGAPVIGPEDYAVESGNGRMMAIRLARQGNLPGAVQYTEMLRNRATEFGFRPEQVGPNSVLVRVRDTPVNRADFTRAANVQTTARMSSPEQAKVDAERITPEMLAKYNMETDTATDAFKGKQNQDFLDAFLKTIPNAEMGETRDSKGMISEDGKDRVRNALIQFAYNSDRLTRALIETKNESAQNLKRVLSNLAPVFSNYRADISEGRFEDIGLLDTLSEAVENYVDLKARGENVYGYVNNYVMEGFEEISNAAKEMMVMFEQNVRSGKKIGRYLTDLIRDVTKPQDSNQTSMIDFGEIPTDLASTIRGSFDQTAQAIENEANGIAKGQVQFDRVSAQDLQQRDTEYQQAVDNGDTESAQKMVDEAAEAAMQDSKVRNENGKLRVVYHGTGQKFNTFDLSKVTSNSDVQGFFFSPYRIYSETFGENVGAYYVDIKNPATADEAKAALDMFRHQKDAGAKARDYLISQGYDGVDEYGNMYLAFYPEQIKSADPVTRDDNGNVIPLSMRFNQRNPDIQYARVGSQAQAQAENYERQNGKPVKSPEQIAKDLVAKLGVGDYLPTKKLNTLSKKVLGYYEGRAKYIAVSPKEVGNFTTTMHEIGHAIADKIGITGDRQMVMNLPEEFHQEYNEEELQAESVAEFMWRYMESDQRARQFAGDAFVDDFERRMEDAGIADPVHEAANQIRQFLNASGLEKIKAVTREASDRERKPIREWFRSVIAGDIDASSAAENLNSRLRKETGNRDIAYSVNVRKNNLMANAAEKRAAFILTKGMEDATWTRTGEDGLAQVFEKNNVKTKEDIDLLSSYLLAKHSFDRDAQGKPVFSPTISAAQRRNTIADVENNHKNIVAAAEGFQNFRKSFIQHFLVDTGYLSQEAFDRMNEMYPNYVPTYRFREGQSNGLGKSGYQVKSATGGTEDIIKPFDSFCSMVKSIVNMVSQNNTALALHDAYQSVGNLGEFMRQVTPDTHAEKQKVSTKGIQNKVKRIIDSYFDTMDVGNLTDDMMKQVLDTIGESQESSRLVFENGTKVPNAITVQLPDGTQAYYEVKDQELYKLLSAVPPAQIEGLKRTFGRATRAMTAVTTGSNPLFAFRNAMRDYQNSVNYGSWAATYLTGLPKWLKAFHDVWAESNDFKDYEALGGGGWLRIDPSQKKSARELRNELLPGYENGTAKGRTSKALNKVSALVTLEKLNEVIEQTSRFVEYKYGKRSLHDTSTAEGRAEAFLAAQDVTVDFGRRGNSGTMNVVKQLIPFFSAATQGVYRTGRMFTEAERSRALPRFAKTVFNTALMSALAAGILLKKGKEEEKFAFENMSDDLKSNHVFFPNFAPHVFGPRPLIRIPLAQDPLSYAVHGFMTNALWYGTRDQNVIDIAAIANTILDNLNPASGGPIWSAISDVQKNKTWYGSKIIPTRLEDLDTNPTAQYTEDTMGLFVGAARGLETVTKALPVVPTVSVSPLNLQYLAEQYTGFLGQLLIPALSTDKHTGELGGWQAAITAAQNRFTTDPLISNEVVGTFYDNFNFVSDVVTTVKDGQPLNMLRTGISQGDANRAYSDAEKLTGKDGVLAKTKKRVTELYAHIDKTNANTSLSDEDKYRITSEDRMQMVKACLRANEEVEKFRENYVTGIDIATSALWMGILGPNPTVKNKSKKK